VAELIAWLDYSFEDASAQGFNFNYRLEPIRPVPSQSGPQAVIRLEFIRALVRTSLERLSGYELPFAGLSAQEQDAQWKRWWEGVRRDPQWHRGAVPEYEDAPRLFEPERSRVGGR
jgi:hypothetical protein